METTKNFCVNAKAWISKHRYGFLQTVFFTLLVISSFWMYFSGELHNISDRDFWTRMEGYFGAFILSFYSLLWFFSDTERKFRAFIFAVMWGYLLTLVWCAYWEISYLLPIAAAALITLCYKDIRTDDDSTSNKTIACVIFVIWGLTAFVPSLVLSFIGYKFDLKKQEYAKQALEIPAIKAVDYKDCYIYTEEYGLERTYNSPNIPKGSMIHRLPVEDGKVFVTVE